MQSIRITMKDKTVREFQERGRSGGSYTEILDESHSCIYTSLTMKSEPDFLVITNEWGEQTWIPSADIAEVKALPGRSF